MKTISGAILSRLLTNSTFLTADLYTFTLANGAGVLRYNNTDSDVTLGGNVFKGGQLRINRSLLIQKIGLEADDLSIDVYPEPNIDPTFTVNGIVYNWLTAGVAGIFDACAVKVERVFMPTWGDTSDGSMILFSGNVSDLSIGRSTITITVRSLVERLNVNLPRHVIQPACRWTLYDAHCLLTKATFKVSAIVLVNSTRNAVLATLAQATGYFDLGTIEFTSGQNLNARRSVKTFVTGGTINVSFPLAYAPVAGDTFDIYPGCDHLQATCSGKFGNLVHFGGFPYVPQPETAI